MAQIVYTNIDRFGELGEAKWSAGDQESYDRTQKMADSRCGISIIGRRDANGSVQLCYAKSNSETNWRVVNGFHVMLAKYLSDKLNEAPAGDVLKPFFDRIEDPAAANALVQLVGTRCGMNGSPDDVRNVINIIGYDLRALGLPYGDWAYIPMRAAFEAAQR